MPSKIYPPAIPVPIETSYIGDNQVTFPKVGAGILSITGFVTNPNNVVVPEISVRSLLVNPINFNDAIGTNIFFMYEGWGQNLVGPSAIQVYGFANGVIIHSATRTISFDVVNCVYMLVRTVFVFTMIATPTQIDIWSMSLGAGGTSTQVSGTTNFACYGIFK
jgi:hypothetical protein